MKRNNCTLQALVFYRLKIFFKSRDWGNVALAESFVMPHCLFFFFSQSKNYYILRKKLLTQNTKNISTDKINMKEAEKSNREMTTGCGAIELLILSDLRSSIKKYRGEEDGAEKSNSKNERYL